MSRCGQALSSVSLDLDVVNYQQLKLCVLGKPCDLPEVSNQVVE